MLPEAGGSKHWRVVARQLLCAPFPFHRQATPLQKLVPEAIAGKHIAQGLPPGSKVGLAFSLSSIRPGINFGTNRTMLKLASSCPHSTITMLPGDKQCRPQADIFGTGGLEVAALLLSSIYSTCVVDCGIIQLCRLVPLNELGYIECRQRPTNSERSLDLPLSLSLMAGMASECCSGELVLG